MSKNGAVRQIQGGYGTPERALLALVYGRIGSGKTADTIFSLPNAYFVAASGAIEKPGKHLCGWVPNGVIGDRLRAAEVKQHIVSAARAGYKAAVIDDWGLMAENTLQYHSNSTTHAFWQALRFEMKEIRVVGREHNIHVIVNAHPQPTTILNDGSRIAGGAKFPIKKLAEEIPTLFDMVLHCRVNPQRVGREGVWPYCYSNVPEDEGWQTKDRHDVCWDATPMNLREILAARGYQLARAPGFDWQEEIVEQGAQGLLAGAAGTDIATWVWQTMEQRHPIAQLQEYLVSAGCAQDPWLFAKHHYWTIRDIQARAQIRKHLQETVANRANSVLQLY